MAVGHTDNAGAIISEVEGSKSQQMLAFLVMRSAL